MASILVVTRCRYALWHTPHYGKLTVAVRQSRQVMATRPARRLSKRRTPASASSRVRPDQRVELVLHVPSLCSHEAREESVNDFTGVNKNRGQQCMGHVEAFDWPPATRWISGDFCFQHTLVLGAGTLRSFRQLKNLETMAVLTASV